MGDNTDDKNNGNSFEYRLKEVTDEEIVSILRYREHFQKHAVNAAIKEALKRGIIDSVDDLDSEKFSPVPLPPKSLFPLANTEAQNIAIFKSLCRIFYGFGLIPIIYGITLALKQEVWIEAVIYIVFGVSVLFAAYGLEKKRELIYSQIFVSLNLPVIAFAVFKLIKMNKPTLLDAFAVVIIVLSVLYTTVYANKLVNYLKKKRDE